MERRNFLKVSALSGALTALESCGSPEHQLIRFIPDEDLVPGIATWKPGVCTLCSAGCGTLVRVIQGDAEVVRNGQTGVVKMGLAKKLEGNPEHPVNRAGPISMKAWVCAAISFPVIEHTIPGSASAAEVSTLETRACA